MTEPPLFSRDFGFLTLAHALQALGYASMLLLPLYLAHLDANRAQIGAVMSIASFGGLAMRPAIGWSLDALGRKTTLVAGTFILVAGLSTFLIVDAISWPIYGARLLIGIGTGALFAGYFAFASDIVPAKRRTQGLALFGVSGLIPLIVNPIAERMDVQPADLRNFFLLIAVPVLASIVPLLLVRGPASRSVGSAPTMKATLKMLASRPLWSVWLATIALAAMVSVYMAFATVVAASRGFALPATLWFFYAGGAAAVRLFGGRLPDQIGPGRLVPPALAIYSAAALFAAWSATPFAMQIGALLAGAGHGLAFPVIVSQLVARVPEQSRGAGTAALTALWEVGALIGAPVFGAVADRFGDVVMFTVASAFSIAAIVFWIPLERVAVLSMNRAE